MPTRVAFMKAVEQDDAKCLKLLIQWTPQEVVERHGSNLLLAASKLGHVSAMKYLAELPGVDVTHVDEWNWNALHIASVLRHVEAVKFLLQVLGSFASNVDQEGRTALHHAVVRGNINITRLLLPQASSDILRADYDGFSPLDYAVMQDCSSIVKTLIDFILPGDPLRHQSAILCQAVSECHHFDTTMGLHMTPWPTQFQLPSIEILQTLLRSGQFDLNAKYFSGRTALHLAAAQPYWLSNPAVSLCKAESSRLSLLLSMTEVDVNAGDNAGRTPIFYIWDAEMDAVHSYDFEEQESLDQARTPKFNFWLDWWGAKWGVQETKLQMLIDAGADANRQRRGGQTVLHDAALRTDQSSIGLLKILLQAPGIVVDIKDDDGHTPLSLATDKTRPLLLSAGASKECQS